MSPVIPPSSRFTQLQLVLLKQIAERIRRVLPFAELGEQRSRLQALLVVLLTEIAKVDVTVLN